MQHTHVGRKPVVNYQHTGRNFGHTEQVAGQWHALNRSTNYGRSCYRSLCGKVVSEEYEHWTGDYVIKDHVKPAQQQPVTCKMCLRRMK